jgi:hypothetical protein
MMIFENKDSAYKIADFSHKLYPQDLYLMFYMYFIRIRKLKEEIHGTLREMLGSYIILDKEKSYDYNFRDTQLLEILLAELNTLDGNIEMREKILTTIDDSEALRLWETLGTEV